MVWQMVKRALFTQGQAVEDAKHDSAEAAAHLAAASHLIGTDDPALSAFFTAFTRYANPEDLIHYTGAELGALVTAIYRHTAVRHPGTPFIDVFDASLEDGAFARLSETIVVAVCDDMPFLYDSTTPAVRAEAPHLAAAFHPVIPTARAPSGRRPAGGR